jgi:hypothetical protein
MKWSKVKKKRLVKYLLFDCQLDLAQVVTSKLSDTFHLAFGRLL